MRMDIVSRCHCCDDEHKLETIEHLFLTSPIAQKLWEKFAFCAGIKLHGIQLQRVITNWWKAKGPIKIKRIFKIVPAILLWELWKRRNARRHDKNVSLFKLVQQCQHTINQFIRYTYPWITSPTHWEGIVKYFYQYKPKLYYQAISWQKPKEDWVKCNTDGSSKGNPGDSAYAFCIRDVRGDLIFAEAQQIGITTNIMAEAVAVLKALSYCRQSQHRKVIVETDSLGIRNFLLREWKIPWELSEILEDAIAMIEQEGIQVKHVFREGNQLADALANNAHNHTEKQVYNQFNQLPVICRKILNMDKRQVMSLRIKTRKIKTTTNQYGHHSH
ncbi:hypothetical protein KY290_021199 [Solanum tuberosum]|uniref:RNase H type-1 domain-containing protein n=1 Tax=Solanum tuberosum TaxID=4113 RepID=A0ABQ7V0T6_SOLTU|nr:hypothetical protein KY290_021199 [Solanum tuberosum]